MADTLTFEEASQPETLTFEDAIKDTYAPSVRLKPRDGLAQYPRVDEAQLPAAAGSGNRLTAGTPDQAQEKAPQEVAPTLPPRMASPGLRSAYLPTTFDATGAALSKKPIVPVGQLIFGTADLMQGMTPEQQQDHYNKLVVGVGESVRDNLDALTTPENLTLLGLGGALGTLGSLARRGVAAAFAWLAAKHLPETYRELKTELEKPKDERDQRKIGQIVGNGAAQLGITALAGREAIMPNRLAAKTEPAAIAPVEEPPVETPPPETKPAEAPPPPPPEKPAVTAAPPEAAAALAQPEAPKAEAAAPEAPPAEAAKEPAAPVKAAEKLPEPPGGAGATPPVIGAAAVPKPKGIAASVRNKWTSATEGPVTGESGFITLAPIKELWDKAAPAVRASIEAVRAAYRENMDLAKTSDYRRAILHWSGKLQRSFGEAADAQKEIQSKVKDPVRREGITNWIQANGDNAVLTQRLAATKDPKLRAGYEAALKLTPEEIAVANDVKRAYDALGQRGQFYDVLKSFKNNYVTQIWNLTKSPTGGFGMFGGARTLRDKFRFSKASTFPTFFDGEQAGFVPKTKDISKLLPVYLHEMNSVIAARQLVEQLSKGVASDGEPLLAARGAGTSVEGEQGKATLVFPKVPKGDTGHYVTIPNQPALHGWRWATKDPEGNPVFVKSDLAVHPEAAAKLKNVLGKSAISEWYRSSGSASASLPKALVRGLDFAQSETKRTMLGLLTPFHQVQEGTHGVGHRVNPFWNNPTIDLVNNPHQMDAAQHGLMLAPDRASADQFMEGFKQSKIVSVIPGIGPLADHYAYYLFHQYIPGLKFKTYEAMLARNQKVYAKELANGKATLEDVKILSAEQANAAYGHLNYADLGRNPTIQHFLRLGLLAPDFLEARMRFAGQAIKGLAGAKIGREQVIALGTLAVAQAAGAYLFAQMMGGQWDKKDPFSFHVGNRKFTLRSVPEDAYRALKDARAFWSARLNPLTRGIDQLRTGIDWRGQKVTAKETLKEMLQQPIPLALRPLFGTANSPLSGWEQLAGSAGLKISRYSAQSEVRNLAHEWMKKSQDPKILAAEQRYEKETLPDSDYKPLREALINNDEKTAKKAYAKLLESRSAEVVSRAMTQSRPFSGSASRESKFKASLSDENKLLYDQALREREELRNKFRKLVGLTNAPTTINYLDLVH